MTSNCREINCFKIMASVLCRKVFLTNWIALYSSQRYKHDGYYSTSSGTKGCTKQQPEEKKIIIIADLASFSFEIRFVLLYPPPTRPLLLLLLFTPPVRRPEFRDWCQVRDRTLKRQKPCTSCGGGAYARRRLSSSHNRVPRITEYNTTEPPPR